jgi:hypothetical protein
MTFAAPSSRTLSATAAAPATAVWHLPGAASARARLETGLIAGDPTGETTLGWTVALDLMGLYQLTDSVQARTRANELITNLAELPDPEIAKLGRTPHASANRAARPFRPSQGVQRTHREPQPQSQNHQAPAATAISNTIDYDSCSTTAASTKTTHRHGSEPAVPASLRRTG